MTVFDPFMTRDERAYFKQACRDVISHYGRDHQYIKLAEEATEFVAALMRLSNAPERVDLKVEMMDELADMAFVLQQIVDEMPANTGRVFAQTAISKAARQLKRIEEEKSHD